MPTEMTYLFHYAAGGAAFILYWATLLQRKGSAPHRRNGRLFLIVLVPVIVSVGGILLRSGQEFAPPRLVQFVYLSICVFTVGSTAWLAIRLKRDLEAFRGMWFKTAGLVAFGMGGVVLAAGIATGDPMPVLFSVIGLIYGGAMLRFAFMRAMPYHNWHLIWHLNGMTLLFNAVHGTLFAIVWRAAVDPSAGPELNFAMQVLTMLIALALRLWFGRRHDAPLRLAAVSRHEALA